MVVWADQMEPNFFKVFGIENYGLEALYQVPRDVVIAPWHYNRVDEFSYGNTLNELGFDMHLWSSFNNWDMFPMMNATARNVESYTPFAHKLHALGIIHSSWKDWNSFNEYNWPQAIYFSEWAWESPGRPMHELLPLAVESFYGPHTGELTSVLFLLGDIDKYFGWGIIGLGAPGYTLFFDPIEPRKLNEETQQLQSEFREKLNKAKDTLMKVKKTASLNTEHLDYIEFAIQQQEFLADLIQCRHLLAGDDESIKQAQGLLKDIQNRFFPLYNRFTELWLRSERPLGLEPNKAKWMNLKKSIDEGLADSD
jgi:hypothetical protein